MRLGYWIGLFFFGLIFTLIIFLNLYQQPPVDWSPSFHKNETAPLGSRIFYELIKKGKENGRFEDVNIPPHEFLRYRDKEGGYLFYNTTISWSHVALDTLFEWVSRGNTALISAAALPSRLQDTLAFSIERLEGEWLDKTEISLELKDNAYTIDKKYVLSSKFPIDYIAIDSAINYNTLGELKIELVELDRESEVYPHFIEIPMLKGRFLIHSLPVVFSNYFLLEESNLDYLEDLIGHLPSDQALYHDNFYKDGRQVQQSPLSVLLGDRSLRMAYYCVLMIGVCWVVFEGKRKQRAIPVIRTPRNLSLDFTSTLAQLYASRKAHDSMVKYQLAYFKEFLSHRYQIQLDLNDQDSWRRLSEKSGRPEESVRKELIQLSKIQQSLRVSEKDLMRVNEIVTTYTHE